MVVIVFVAAIALRLALSLENLGAEYGHMDLCRHIASEKRLPAAEECAECFNAKLFHVLVATCINLGKIYDASAQTLLAQLISCFAGILTLVVFYYFLTLLSLSRWVKFWAFSLVALNPRLISINVQATNDSLAIFFGACTIFFAYRFFSKGRIWRFVVMAIFSILAGLTKGTAVILCPIIFLILVLKALTSPGSILDKIKHRYCRYALILLVLFLVTVPFGGQYVRIRDHHIVSIFPDKMEFYPLPNFLKETYYGRPGITSVANSYLTFRLVDMLKHPTITNDEYVYPLHRTSFWSQLYGRANFIYFDFWPPRWEVTDPLNLNLGRAIMILALIPTGLFLWGFFKEMGRWVIAVARFDFGFIFKSNEWVFFVFAVAQLMFLIYGSAIHRDFCFVKAIFLFPSLLAAMYIFTLGLGAADRALDKTRWRVVLDFVFGALVVLYSLSVVSLIMKVRT